MASNLEYNEKASKRTERAYLSPEIVRAVRCIRADMAPDCDPIPPGFFGASVNSINDFEAIGGELVAAWLPRKSFQLSGSYGYSRLIDAMPTQKRFPEHLIKLSLKSAFLDDRVTTRIDLQMNNGFDSEAAGWNPVFKSWRIQLNLSLACEIQPGVTLNFAARNLTGEHTPSLHNNGIPIQGVLGQKERLFYLGLTLRHPTRD
jgi:hypothetical protein